MMPAEQSFQQRAKGVDSRAAGFAFDLQREDRPADGLHRFVVWLSVRLANRSTTDEAGPGQGATP
jgi:hypothetical protein